MNHSEYTVLANVQSIHCWFRTLNKYIFSTLLQESRLRARSLTVFDAGCGCGGLLTKLRELSYVSTARGCEPYYGLLTIARARISMSIATIEAVTADKKYDVVTCIDVLVLSSVDVNQA